MRAAAWLLPLVPALAALAGAVGGRGVRRLPGGPAGLAVGAATVTALLAVALAADVLREPGRVSEQLTTLTPTGGIAVGVGVRVDGLAAVTAVMVSLVALAVQVYSTSYLRGDPRYAGYAWQVSLFTAGMLLVVLAADLVELLVGWEVMGLCSYLLVGHHWEVPAASAAAVKAFLVTRAGDVGLLVGIVVLGAGASSYRIGAVVAAAPRLPHATVLAGALLVLAGVVGKSAQFPLHTWLPDAMAGPTPVSALIHAATMVAAGVYLVARLYPVFLAAPESLAVLGVLAAVTMLLGALVALVTDDLKRVLAWSTVSQLAYMTGGLAVGGYTPALLHLVNHAAFKALLFLCAGAVIRTVGTNLMSEMGGLARRMPATFGATVVGAAALAGVPPASGAFSKDAVLGAAYDAGFAGGSGSGIPPAVAATVYLAGLVTVVLTAAYATRLVVRVFLGEHRGGLTPADLQEPPPAMAWPVALLASAALLLGALDVPGALPRAFPAPVAGAGELHVAAAPLLATGVAVVFVAAGVVAVWRRAPAADPADLLGPVAVPLRRAFYVDEAYRAVLVTPVRATGRWLATADRSGIDGVVVGLGAAADRAGGALRRLQTGNVQTYLTAMLAGVLALALGVAVLR